MTLQADDPLQYPDCGGLWYGHSFHSVTSAFSSEAWHQAKVAQGSLLRDSITIMCD